VIRDRAPGRGVGERTVPDFDTSLDSASSRPTGTAGSPVVGGRRRVTTHAAGDAHVAGDAHAVDVDQLPAGHQACGSRRVAWSRARLAGAVSATRCVRGAAPSNRPLRDELDFFAAAGKRRDVPAGTALVHRGSPMDEVHLLDRGAAAVLGNHRGRRPILALTLRGELCCAAPALLHQKAPWDAVAVTNAAVITVPVDVFISAVRERWVDRWTTRTLSWLAAVGARIDDLDPPEPAAQVAALLLRARGAFAAKPCRRTISDLLDLDDSSVRDALEVLEVLGAVDLSGRRVAIIRTDILRRVAAGTS